MQYAGSSQKPAQMQVMTGSSSISSATINAQITTALAGGALPSWLAISPRPEGQLPVAFLNIYQKLLAVDGSYRI
jgi:hypothetical protein